MMVKLAGEARGGVAIVYAQFPPRAVAVGVDRRLRHAELPGDLLGGEMLVDEPQALPFTGGEQIDVRFGHRSNARIRRTVNAPMAVSSTLP